VCRACDPVNCMSAYLLALSPALQTRARSGCCTTARRNLLVLQRVISYFLVGVSAIKEGSITAIASATVHLDVIINH
jgi:hypothetical protein